MMYGINKVRNLDGEVVSMKITLRAEIASGGCIKIFGLIAGKESNFSPQ